MNSTDYKYEFYKELYYHEMDIKDKIGNRINFSFGLTSILVGGVAYCYQKYLEFIPESVNLTIVIIFGLLILAFLFSAYYIIRSFFGYSYDYIAPAREIEEGYKQYRTFYDENKESYMKFNLNIETELKKSFTGNIIQNYISATTKNREQNINKSKYLRKYSISILFVLFFIVLNITMISVYDYREELKNDKATIEILKGGEKIYELRR